MTERICAVVVTFNRQALLRDCIKALLAQTRAVDGLIVINNASTDGTRQLLEEMRSMPDVDVVHMPVNIGGAGGFNAGLKRAREAGFDRFWLMDDDGAPSLDCLEILLRDGAHVDFLGPLVVSTQDSTLLARTLRCPRTGRPVGRKDEALAAAENGLILGSSNPFNGTLLTRRLTDKIGFPKGEMFIWGDEVEYELRASKAGFSVGTAVNACHIHPPEVPGNMKPLLGRFQILFPEDRLRMYCRTRNYGYIFSRYGKLEVVLKELMKATLYCVSNGRWGDLLVYYQALFHGLTGDFRHHGGFLKVERGTEK